MYKLLPILLFAFLVAEIRELSTGEFYYLQSDSLDLIWAETKIDWWINRLDEQLSNIIDKDKFQINIDRKVYDVKRIDKLYADYADSMVVDSIKKVMQASFPQKHTRTFTSVSDEKYWRLAVFKIIIEISVDKTINLDGHYKNALKSIIDSGYLIWDKPSDDIIFKSVDIEEFKSQKNNKQLILNRDDIYDDSWAVIIGIDKYKYSDQLNYAVKDAEAVKDMLINKFDYPEENIRYLVDEEATLSKIKLALNDISTSADENDRVLVFYSGHGETQKNNDGTETGYIIPVEGRQDKPYATGLAMDEILRTCQMSNAKHMLFLMDACYSGLMTENVKGLSKPQEEGYLSKVANEKARQIITAGGGNEQVIERDEWQHSAFTKNLLAGLDDWEADTDDDGYITADELGTYLRKSVTEDSDFQQTPQKGRFRNSGGGEFVFFSNHIINQNVEEKSTDEKLDLLSRIERLESQSMADKTKPDLKVKPEIYKSTAYFKIGMTEKEFNRKNPNIIEKNEEEEFPIYIENCKDKYTYIAGIAFPLPRCEEYTFTFKNDTLEAVYRGRNNFNREIDYSMYPNAKP